MDVQSSPLLLKLTIVFIIILIFNILKDHIRECLIFNQFKEGPALEQIYYFSNENHFFLL